MHSAVVENGVAASNSEIFQQIDLPKLLIVGDPNNLKVAQAVIVELELCWEVIFARSRHIAMEILSAKSVDVVMIDLGNAEIEGIPLVESIKADFSQIPIVLLSAPYKVCVALEAMKLGAHNHFPRELLNHEPAAVLAALSDAEQSRNDDRKTLQCLDSVQFEFTLENDRSLVPPIIEKIQRTILEMGLCNRPNAMRVGVALQECVVNAIVHGNLEVSSELRQDGEDPYYQAINKRRSELPYASRRVSISAKISSQSAAITIRDEGPGFNYNDVADPTNPDYWTRVGGRGLLLMRSFMNEVNFNDRGNHVTLIKHK